MVNEYLGYIYSSFVSAFVSKTAIAPLERLKILRQSDIYYKYNKYNSSILGSLRYIIKNEGYKGLYKGNMINICESIAKLFIKVSLNEFGYKYMKRYNEIYYYTRRLSYLDKFNVGVMSD